MYPRLGKANSCGARINTSKVYNSPVKIFASKSPNNSAEKLLFYENLANAYQANAKRVATTVKRRTKAGRRTKRALSRRLKRRRTRSRR